MVDYNRVREESEKKRNAVAEVAGWFFLASLLTISGLTVACVAVGLWKLFAYLLRL